MLVREVMTRDVAAVDSDSSILDASVKMKLYDVGMIVVSEDGRLAGVVTDRDIVVRGVAEGADPTFYTVKHLMTTQVLTCREDDTLEAAADLMRSEQVRRLIVVDSTSEPVGVLALSDIVQRGAEVGLAGQVLRGVTEPAIIETVRPHDDE